LSSIGWLLNRKPGKRVPEFFASIARSEGGGTGRRKARCAYMTAELLTDKTHG